MISHLDVQKIVDDLDFARAFFPSDSDHEDIKEARRSINAASEILTSLTDEAIDALPNHLRR